MGAESLRPNSSRRSFCFLVHNEEFQPSNFGSRILASVDFFFSCFFISFNVPSWYVIFKCMCLTTTPTFGHCYACRHTHTYSHTNKVPCSHLSTAMAQETNPSLTPVLCATGCGFYGNPRNNGMCSVCYKEHLNRQQSSTHGLSQLSPMGKFLLHPVSYWPHTQPKSTPNSVSLSSPKPDSHQSGITLHREVISLC